eukprot:14102186-Alexandrium_andersonii.AAC.1
MQPCITCGCNRHPSERSALVHRPASTRRRLLAQAVLTCPCLTLLIQLHARTCNIHVHVHVFVAALPLALRRACASS